MFIFYISWHGGHTRPFCLQPLYTTSVLLPVNKKSGASIMGNGMLASVQLY